MVVAEVVTALEVLAAGMVVVAADMVHVVVAAGMVVVAADMMDVVVAANMVVVADSEIVTGLDIVAVLDVVTRIVVAGVEDAISPATSPLNSIRSFRPVKMIFFSAIYLLTSVVR